MQENKMSQATPLAVQRPTCYPIMLSREANTAVRLSDSCPHLKGHSQTRIGIFHSEDSSQVLTRLVTAYNRRWCSVSPLSFAQPTQHLTILFHFDFVGGGLSHTGHARPQKRNHHLPEIKQWGKLTNSTTPQPPTVPTSTAFRTPYRDQMNPNQHHHPRVPTAERQPNTARSHPRTSNTNPNATS